MTYFYPTLHQKHDPAYDYSDGLPPFAYMESVPRMDAVMRGVYRHVKKEDIVLVDGLIDEKYLSFHDEKYIKFLKDICEDLDEDEDFIPSMFRDDLSDAPLRFQAGMYCKEVGTPLQKGTFFAASNSAKTALEGAKYVLEKNVNAFALTRPPGHHSGVKSYGGYGFINNAFLATNFLVENELKTIMLDLDYHIGDGSVELCEKYGLEYFSLHIDPWKNYPYLTKDVSFKQNIHLSHLAHETSSVKYLEKLSLCIEQIKSLNPDVLVLSLGFDTLKSDYCQDQQIGLENEDFFGIARLIKTLNVRVLVCLEGGYDKEHLSEAVDYFLQGMDDEKKDQTIRL